MKPFSISQTWLECISCGFRTDLLDEKKFRCPKCGDLFELNHNFDILENKSLTDFARIFDERARNSSFNNNNNNSPLIRSGVWRFKEWIMPFVPDNKIITLGEGAAPIVKAGKNLKKWIGGNIDLWMILNGMAPTGSFKDIGMTVLMTTAKEAGADLVACVSTGDTSAATAAYAAKAGLKSAVILPRGKVTDIQLSQPLMHGSKVITLPASYDECVLVLRELIERGLVYPSNSINPSRIEGHKTTVFQIAQFFKWSLPEWIAIPVGNGSNATSVGRAMRLMQKFGLKKISKILGCQSRAASPLARSWNLSNGCGSNFLNNWRQNFQPMSVGKTSATAACIGNPVSREKAMREIVYSGGAMQIAEEKNLNDAVIVCGLDGYFVCPQTGIALAGVREGVKRGWIKKGESVVVVSTALGLKFTESATRNLRQNIIEASNARADAVASLLKL